MAHGYLREYNEGWDRDDDRQRSERDWRERDRDWSDRGRGFMLGDEERGRFRDESRRSYRDRDDDRGFFSRMGDEARSWFHEDEREGGRNRRDRGAWENNRDWPQRNRGMSGGYGREHGFGGFQGDYGGGREQGGFGGMGDYREGRRSYSANPDDHYRSWRDRQMQALDRDYQDYCREREQQFHQDFDSWRQNRKAGQQPLQPGMTESGQEVMELNEAAGQSNAPDATSAMDAATLGTNENAGTGRGRR